MSDSNPTQDNLITDEMWRELGTDEYQAAHADTVADDELDKWIREGEERAAKFNDPIEPQELIDPLAIQMSEEELAESANPHENITDGDETDGGDFEIEQGETINLGAVEPDPTEFQQGYLIAPEQLIPTKGKTLEALAYSRQARENIVRAFRGLVPQSVMLADKASRDEADLATGSYEESGQLAKKRARGEQVKSLPKTFEVSGRGGASGALSKFPQNIGRAILLLYTNELDTVFDPFAGHNSRMELCVRARRHYVGQDLSHNFVVFNRARAALLRETFPEISISILEGNSQQLQMPDAQGDFTITSPPYWDIEYYGDEPNQLGFSKTYDDFMDGMQLVANENYRVLKPGAFCVWFINDFRKGGKFYPYHVDTMHILEEAGFTTWDICITDFGRTFRSVFVNQIVQQKILPKKHEYGWVMRKPGWEKK